MTRINVVPVSELCDKHLLSEHRELTRIPNNISKRKFSFKGQPGAYVLGEGHVKFFYSRLTYLLNRYQALHAECVKRGFRVRYIWPDNLPSLPIFWGGTTPRHLRPWLSIGSAYGRTCRKGLGLRGYPLGEHSKFL